MLEPDGRQLYVEALRPPHGYELADAIATTYSLDLTTLLGVPIALALPHLDARRLGKESAVALLEAIRRASGKVTVFCNRGGIAAPGAQHVLYGLLEPVIAEVAAPNGGCLHSKLWVMRFEPEDRRTDEAVMRLLVLSRNLTADRCWDVSLVLDGWLTGRNRAANRPLAELIEALPGLAVRSVSEQTTRRITRLAEELRRTEWDLPPGFHDVRFHALGLGRKSKPWLPEWSDRLLVVSPFVRGNALRQLAETTKEPLALIARGEELDRVDADARGLFQSLFTLHERAETEAGEDTADESKRVCLRGLHAKVYVAKRGWDTHVYLGSANATDSALLHGMNVEFMAELVGKTSKVPGKGIDGMLSSDGLGAILAEYKAAPVPEVDAAEAAAHALDEAAIALASGKVVLRFEPAGGEYLPVLMTTATLSLHDVAEIRAWLVTMDPSSARDATTLMQTGRAELTRCASASATGLVAFELRAASAEVRSTFTLNLTVEQMPADRDAQVIRVVVDNRDRFFAYLLALLEGLDPDVVAGITETTMNDGSGSRAYGSAHGLLERLVRARARDPKRLRELGEVISALLSTPEGSTIVPQDFLDVWNAVSVEDSP